MNNPPASSLPGGTGMPQGIQDITIEPRRGFDFRHFWHSIMERLWIVALCTVAGLFLSLGYLARTPKLYQSHAVLEVDFQEPTMITGEENTSRIRSMFLASQEALRTIEQNLTNLTLMARVVRSEGLADDGGRALLGRDADEPNEHKTTPAPSKATPAAATDTFGASAFTPMEEGLGRALSGMVKPVIRRGTRLIDLYVTNRDPAMAQRLADAVGREYIRMSIERRASFSQESLRYMMEEEERLKANLRKSEAAVAEYKANTPDALQLGGGAAATGTQQGAGAGGGRGGLVEDQLQDLTSKVTSAKTDRVRLESELSQIEQIGNNTDALLNIPSIANATTVVDRRRDVAQMETTVASLQQRYKSKHPKMMAAQAALTEAKNALGRAVLMQPDVLRNVLSQARAAETSLGSATQDQEKAAIALNKAAIGYQELARQAETDRALYESVLRQIKETNLTKDVKTNAVSVAEHAILPYTPASPQPFKAIALGLLGGLAAGLGFIYGADVLDRSIKTVDQAEGLLGLPVLAAVPEKTDPARTKTKSKKIVDARTTYRLVAEAPEGPVAESFRNLRASLSLLGPEIERRVFLFTSALPSEGKSFTSANYALALAQQGYRVLLVDGDLRRPSLHRIFLGSDEHGRTIKPDSSAPGIVDCLVGKADLSTAVRRVLARDVDVTGATRDDAVEFTTATGGQFSILAGGRRAPNPAELLSGPSFGELIASAARLFDRVVIDSAPIIAVSDTLLMMPFVQTVSLVVRAAKTPRNAAHRALSLLITAGARPAGVILNRLPRRRGVGHYYYYASHGYGAGEGSYGAREGSYQQRKEGKTSILSR
ncbi:MAG: polysaccharide biosynthesis tyrosine autokinase [Chthoniobacterales bacterium]|nr:polysaccharide biosynthesis tyrosine autokinase [Chthoniobacterales bacterium]